MSKFYVHILSIEASLYIYDWLLTNIKVIALRFELKIRGQTFDIFCFKTMPFTTNMNSRVLFFIIFSKNISLEMYHFDLQCEVF